MEEKKISTNFIYVDFNYDLFIFIFLFDHLILKEEDSVIPSEIELGFS
jgi:hypothetical protein